MNYGIAYYTQKAHAAMFGGTSILDAIYDNKHLASQFHQVTFTTDLVLLTNKKIHYK